MKRALLAASALALSLPTAAFAETWEIDSSHTTSAFEVTHMLVSTVRGQFDKTTGTLDIDDKDLTKSTLDITIDASSVNTRNADRDKHLRTAEFFDVEKHPQITFKSTKVEKGKKKDQLKVAGDLTIRGITKPVVLDVTYTGKQVASPWGKTVRGASAIGKINRKDWDIIWNTKLDAGGLAVSNEVTLIIDAEFNQPTPGAAKTN